VRFEEVLKIVQAVWAEMFSLDEADLERRRDAFENEARMISL
jgi:hypothetical protein